MRISLQGGQIVMASVVSTSLLLTTGCVDKPKNLIAIELGEGVRMRLALVPAGTFLMGSPESDKGRNECHSKDSKPEGPQRQVAISRAFYISTTEVTRAQWLALMHSEPWKGSKKVRTGPNYPATHVLWKEAVSFCRAMSRKIGRVVRLPTEAEWEYACRGGASTRFYYGDDPNYERLGDYGWYVENTIRKNEKYAHPVARKKPNAWGLFDMHGNVEEWCADWYTEAQATADAAVDPKGPASGHCHVVRGGAWDCGPRYCRAGYQLPGMLDPTHRYDTVGFRVVVEVEQE